MYNSEGARQAGLTEAAGLTGGPGVVSRALGDQEGLAGRGMPRAAGAAHHLQVLRALDRPDALPPRRAPLGNHSPSLLEHHTYANAVCERQRPEQHGGARGAAHSRACGPRSCRPCVQG